MRSTTNSGRARSARKETTGKAKRPAGSGRRSAVIRELWEDPRTDFTEDEWHDMVAAAASQRVEAGGFLGEDPEDEWWEAEARLREQVARAEDEADEKSESAADLDDHDTWREHDRT